MQLSQLFNISPFLSLSLCVCLGTVLWCILLLRRGCHHFADRFLIGFVGLLSVYHCLQILKRAGIVPIAPFHQLDEAVDLLVNSLYLLAALLLRVSNHDRFATIFRLRLAEAQSGTWTQEILIETDSGTKGVLEKLASVAPSLSEFALRLYLYICLRAGRHGGALQATEEELLQFIGKDRKALLAALKELRERGLCDVQVEQTEESLRIRSVLPRRTDEQSAVAP